MILKIHSHINIYFQSIAAFVRTRAKKDENRIAKVEQYVDAFVDEKKKKQK